MITESHNVLHYQTRTFDSSFLVEDIGQVALATVLPVSHAGLDIMLDFGFSLANKHSYHEDTGTAGLSWALAAETLDLAIAINLVVLENSQLGLLAYNMRSEPGVASSLLTFLRLCLIFLGVVYTFFLRFLAIPPRSLVGG